MPPRGRHSSWIISPGSAALADILANSVAVILILILVTLAYRQEQSRSELERSTDITTILAREVATSVVYNDLPSSPPSVLHDYDSCDIPHDCDLTLYPIFELRQGHLRIFNTNTRIHRAELLRRDNAFDRYLAALTPEEQQWIRMDVHSVSEYYLVLGIMQEHGLRPRHWHYLGEHAEPLANPGGLAARVDGITELQKDYGASLSAAMEDGGDDWLGAWSGRRDVSGDGPAGLEGTRLGGIGVLNELNYDSLLPPAAGRNRSSGARSGNPSAPRPGRRGGSIFDRPGQPGPLGTPRQTMRLFVPNTMPPPPGQAQVLEVAAEHYAPLMLSYLFRVLEDARAERAFNPARQNAWLLALARELHGPRGMQALAALPHYELAAELAAALRANPFPAYPALQSLRLAPALPYNRLLLEPNAVEGALALRLNQAADWLSPLRDARKTKARFLLRSHPSLFKGEALELPAGHVLLLLPDEIDSPAPAWRPVAVIDGKLQNVALGFAYGGMEDARFALHAGANQLQLNGRPAANPRLSAGDRLRQLTPALWALALLGLLLLPLLRFAPRRGD